MKALTLALLSLSLSSLSGSAAPATTLPRCAEVEALPFPLPSEEVSADWGDAEFAVWESAQWATYCGNNPAAAGCNCVR